MKTQKRVRKVKAAKAVPLPSQDVKTETTVNPYLQEVQCPPPDYLLQKAMGEPDRRLLEEYDETIRVLRDEKRFTFREIADWLNENGIECDHNAVYREYTKGMSDADAQREEAEDSYAEEKVMRHITG